MRLIDEHKLSSELQEMINQARERRDTAAGDEEKRRAEEVLRTLIECHIKVQREPTVNISHMTPMVCLDCEYYHSHDCRRMRTWGDDTYCSFFERRGE